ncbi:hypothetical protein [Amycolatopsis sp. FDAARGOS 1241]|uniref:hypothetical protein n=1 Tax=Amycolatopsis sp. FDAARGOS 1241 TaxID=2778070 RepID=UPI0019508D8D|nr:hypothetical protein [Amycolatopsis sp. FDAARGOS 1241]QRP47993.1 hypothetical protein I6J71_08950 [Amycolatopsis sp. FDAARGOS 1241]
MRTYVNPNPPVGELCEHETFTHVPEQPCDRVQPAGPAPITASRANHNYEPSRVNGMGRCGCGEDCATERAWMQHIASLLEPIQNPTAAAEAKLGELRTAVLAVLQELSAYGGREQQTFQAQNRDAPLHRAFGRGIALAVQRIRAVVEGETR